MKNKPRAWHVYGKKMCEVIRIDFEEELVTLDLETDWGKTGRYTFSSVKIMQSTGLKDKNGVEIFEGDVVKVTQYFEGMALGGLIHLVGKSKYNNNLMLIRQSKQRFLPEVSLSFDQSEDYEVIGSIYEDPELLEMEDTPLPERANGQTYKTTTGLGIHEDGRDNSRFELTEQEIKDYDERFWAFVASKGECQ